MAPTARALVLSTVLATWAVLVGGSVLAYTSHAARPGVDAAAPATWPADLARDPARPTLLVFVHPHCPCSRGTVRELARLQAHIKDAAAIRVLFLRSLRTGEDPRGSSLWEDAAHIPGVTVAVDEDASLAKRFAAATSGQTLFYDAAGHLAFAGGITNPGGHEGDNAGRDAIEALALGGDSARPRVSVFGCPLFF